MTRTCTLGILSDIHYASAAEQARGSDYEWRGLANPMLRLLVRLHRRFLWLRDDAACQSTRECLGKLRQKFGRNLRTNFGDHELGKISFFGGRGGMRLASWRRATEELAMEPFWRIELGHYVLMGLVSSLVALPVFQPDTLPAEWPEWEKLRAEHLSEIRQAFAALQPAQRVVLFCHDPTALPFLWREEAVRARLPQI